MRYEIGERIPVISFVTKDKLNGFERRATFFLPWSETVVSSEIVYLTVKEHHRVPSVHDPKNELTCDGYILEDASGCIWYNQYPQASYGQVDDSADRRFRRKDFNREATYWDYVGLFGYMEALLRGEHTFTHGEDTANPERAAALRQIYDDLVARYESTGWKIAVSPLELEFADGSKEIVDDNFTVKGVLPEGSNVPALEVSHDIKLYPHQEEAAKRFIEQGRVALNLPKGLGKGGPL